VTIPNSLAESSAGTFSVAATHWYYGAAIAADWTLDSTVISHAVSASYTPSMNAQGSHTLVLRVGLDNGSGDIDSTKAFLVKNYTPSVQNTFPAVVPALTLTSASPTNSLNVTLSLATGASMANCATFSALALTVDTLTAPLSPAALVTP